MGLANVLPSPLSVAAVLPLVSPRVIVPVPDPPPADVLVVSETVPALIVSPLVNVFAPLKVNCDVALFWTTPVTFVPMTAEMVVVPPSLEPELVIVPVLLTGVVEKVILAKPSESITKLPVPVMPLVKVRVENPTFVIVKLLFRIIAPLRVLVVDT